MQTQQLKKEFAIGLQRILALTRISLGAETAAFYWVNRSKQQFVLASESHGSGGLTCVQRTSFSEHYLSSFTDLREPIILDDTRELSSFRKATFFASSGITPPEFKQLILFPIISHHETVALTVFALQYAGSVLEDRMSSTLHAFEDLYAYYLTLSGSHAQFRVEQQAWALYDEQLDELTELLAGRKGVAKVLTTAMDQLFSILCEQEVQSGALSGSGAILFAVQSLQTWTVVLEKGQTPLFVQAPTAIGMTIEKQTLAMNALESGKAEFLVHANPSPYRITGKEIPALGASYSVPLLLDGQRVGVFVFSHPNPRFFSGSLKHKLINHIRYLSLLLQKTENRIGSEAFQDQHGVLKTDIWQLSLQQIVHSIRETSHIVAGVTGTQKPDTDQASAFDSAQGKYKLVFITPSQLPTLRARFRLEELQQLQQAMAEAISPSTAGVNGWIGRYSEYVFLGFIDGAFNSWLERVEDLFSKGFPLTGGQLMKSGFYVFAVDLHEELSEPLQADPQTLLRKLNSGLTRVISNKE